MTHSACNHHYPIQFTLASSFLRSLLSLLQKFQNFFIPCNLNQSSLDFIPTSLIKACSSTFSSLIAHLANLSFNQGVFPSHLKLAQITPLIKKPKLNRDDPSNYRPISNLNNISKILERLFLARLQPHLISSPHYNPLQSAYRSCHSTETALLTLLNKTRLSADQGESTLLVSLDLCAAFDTIESCDPT